MVNPVTKKIVRFVCPNISGEGTEKSERKLGKF